MTWHWINKEVVLRLHDESLSKHGGIRGLRDEGLLDSALNRPRNLLAYETPDFADLAAAYGYGLAVGSHPFADGNKRAAFLAVGLFLGMNGYCLRVSQTEATKTILSLAAGEL
jgi:death-on-curing protein